MRWSLQRRLFVIAASCLLIAVVVAVTILVSKWSFTREAVIRELEGLHEGKVEMGNFHPTYFPPGCIAQNVTFRAQANHPPSITVEKITIIGSYTGLFEIPKHIRRVLLENVTVTAARHGGLAKPARNSKLVIDEILTTNAKLSLPPEGKRVEPLNFDVRQVTMRRLEAGRPFSYQALVRLPQPPGEVTVEGKAGPFNDTDVGQTPVSGEFVLEKTDLGVFKGIGGTLTAKGKYQGQLEHLNVIGETNMPHFIVKSTEHGLPLTTRFHAFVDGTNGDVTFAPIDSVLGETLIHSTGNVIKDGNDSGKTVSLEMSAQRGRIQDLLYLFVHSNSPMTGTTNFVAKVTLKPQPKRFLERVTLDATFGIADSKFTKTTTQDKVEQLSARTQGDTNDGDSSPVVSGLHGHVKLENGTATFSRLSFTVPGASAEVHGTFNVETQVINLRGMLRTDVKLSEATTGFKAFLMKAIEFAKQKKKQGALVPVKITGTYGKPTFAIDAPKEK